ncbi:LysR family transcriptional regulator [Advenella kashmirensis]
MDWDNLRFFLEIARTGRLASAAHRLGVDQATVSRRMTALETQLGRRLFIRSTTGMALTDAGRQLTVQAESMEAAAAAVEAPGEDASDVMSGIVRVGVTEGFGTAVLAQRLAKLTTLHPLLTVELVAVPAIVNISRREADIVIALERPQRGPYVVTKLTDYVLGFYASEEYLSQSPPLEVAEDLRHHRLVGYVDDLLYSKALRFFNHMRAPNFALRSTSVMAQLHATAAGAGVSILPAFIADCFPGVRIVLPDIRFTRTFWMSMPEEMRNQSRMRKTWDFLRAVAEEHKASLLPG